MGHKVNPVGIRLGITADWKAKWYAKKRDYAQVLLKDIEIRTFLDKQLSAAGVSSIHIERLARTAKITAFVARPGVVIGKKGDFIEQIKKKAEKMMGVPVNLRIEEVRKPELDSKLVAENIAQQLERRVLFRRAIKRAGSSALRLGAKGIKINVSGRLGGAEIARSEWLREGRVPLHTFRADIDYGVAEAKTTYGIIGVKVWIFKGEIFNKGEETLAQLSEVKRQEMADNEQKAMAKKRMPPKQPHARKPYTKSPPASVDTH
jgi:small subunit ribosomal protein S3